jgi:RNA polymerase sigma factor (sigma-70 family)
MSVHSVLGTVYVEHKNWLHSWFRRRIVSADVAHDMVQDTFLKLILSATTVSYALDNPKALLTVVARQLLVDRYRRQALEDSYVQMLTQMPGLSHPSEEERAMVCEILRQLDRALEALPAAVRAAFLLSRLDGLAYEEIADQLDLSVRTVKRYMAQAYEGCMLAQLQLHHGT